MSTHPLSQDDLLGGREVRFLGRQESNYPQLMRMCMDFDFRVLQLLCDRDSGKQFILTTGDYRSIDDAISPPFDTLVQLEAHVAQHQVDILHNYLFGAVEDDLSSLRHAGGE